MTNKNSPSLEECIKSFAHIHKNADDIIPISEEISKATAAALFRLVGPDPKALVVCNFDERIAGLTQIIQLFYRTGFQAGFEQGKTKAQAEMN